MRALEEFRTILCLPVAAIFTVGMAEAGLVNLAGSEWGFAGGTGKAAQFVQFRSDGKVGGHSGCNRLMGTYTRKDDTLTIGPLATTRMACAPEVMEREQQFLTMLSNVRYAQGTHLKLILKDGAGNVLAELVRRDPD